MNSAKAVLDQAPGIGEEALEEARSVIGVWFRRHFNSFEITADAIRHYADALGDLNPLYHDPEYARRSPHGTLVAPPYILCALPPLHAAPKLRGLQWIYAGTSWKFHDQIRLADLITVHARLKDVKVLRGANGGDMVLQFGELLYVNQCGELVAEGQPMVMRTIRSRNENGMRYERRHARHDPEVIAENARRQLAHTARGATSRYVESVRVGDEIEPLFRGPFRAVDFALSGFDAQEGWYGFGQGSHAYQFLHRKRHPADAYRNPETGLDDKAYRGHWEEFMAGEAGMPGMYDMGHHRHSLGLKAVIDWAGDHATIDECVCRLTRPVVVSDIMECRAHVTAVDTATGHVDLDIVGVIQDGQKAYDGRVRVILPRRTVEEHAQVTTSGWGYR